MQPYFLPYIGYFQLIDAVDEFVVYDNIQFTKKGWINRNRILDGNNFAYITLPLKKDSDYLDVKDRYLADIWMNEKTKMLNKIQSSYRKAPFYQLVYPIVEKIILFEENNLFDFIFNSLVTINSFLEIKTKLTLSSSIEIDHNLKSDLKILEICKNRKFDTYINPIGGLELYNKDSFKNKGVELSFLKTNDFKYTQNNNEFIPYLSILDVMMFNSKDKIREMLKLYTKK